MIKVSSLTFGPIASAICASVLALAMGSGCMSQVRLWSNADSDNPHDYTPRSPQYVHVGEIVQFRVTVEPDDADYVLLRIGKEVRLLNRASPGQYSFSKQFDKSWANRTAKLQVQAFKQIGRRDFVKIRSEVIKRPARVDERDRNLGSASMTVNCYQSKVVIKVKIAGTVEPDWRRATLELFNAKGKPIRVGYGKPGQHGFVVLGPKAFGGEYVIYYEPKYNEVRKTGQTPVLFSLPSQLIRAETVINTR